MPRRVGQPLSLKRPTGRAPVPVGDGRGQSLADRVVEWLAGRIIDGTYRPGETLSEQAIVAELGISRTPVREAMARLRHEGLLGVGAGRSAVVADLTEREVREIYLVRAVLAGLTARIVAEKATPADVAAFRALANDMQRAAAAGDLAAFFKANVQFHRVEAQRADNSVVASLVANLGLRVLRLRYLSMGLPTRMDVSSRLHQELVDAFAGNDGATAERISREVIDGACRAILFYHFGVREQQELEVLRGEIPQLVAHLRST